jgi:hypothetical protein
LNGLKNGADAVLKSAISKWYSRTYAPLIALKGKKSDEHLNEKLGYYGDYLLLEAVRQDLGTCWWAVISTGKTQFSKWGVTRSLCCDYRWKRNAPDDDA